MIVHPIDPLFDSESQILILGSFPSVKSREEGFFYGHPHNRFWKLLARLFEDDTPSSIEEKKDFILKHHLALWDVIHSCNITGSADSTISDVVPNDLSVILDNADIKKIYVNGRKAYGLYKKYLENVTGVEAVYLPSTSPANAAMSLDKLADKWKVILSEVTK